MAPLPDQAAFVRVVKALKPYLDVVVFAGAWAHRLFRFHPLANPPDFTPLMSRDADIALPEKLPKRALIRDLLQREGFREEISGSGSSPATSYHLEDEGFYVEFIAGLVGGELDRRGEKANMLAIAGVTAPKLRFVDLLFFEPWLFELKAADGFFIEGVKIRVASPTSYLAQKVLTIRRRQNEQKRAKDVLYVYDTLSLFGAALPQMTADGQRLLDHLSTKTRRTFNRLREDIFVNAGLLAGAAIIAQQSGRPNPPPANLISTVCQLGLATIYPG